MTKILIASILSGFRSVTALNADLQALATELNDKVLYRDNPSGEDNVMKNSLDMNSNTILNLPLPTTGTEAVRFDQITALIAGGAIPVQEEGVTTVSFPLKLNFVGAGATVTDVGSVATITIPSTSVQEEGSEVTAVPSAINFIGASVTVTDVAGVATVTITDADTDTFATLTDTPASFSGEANKVVSVNAGETALEFTTASPSTHLGLTDTASSYSGAANKSVSVNSGESALEFTSPPYDMGLFIPGSPIDDQLLLQFVFDRNVEFPDEFAGSTGIVGTNPTSIATIDIKKNGSSIGTISIATDGVVTFVTAGGSAETFASGDKLELVAQATADATLADVSITFNGIRT